MFGWRLLAASLISELFFRVLRVFFPHLLSPAVPAPGQSGIQTRMPAMTRDRKRCCSCGRLYVPDPFNAHYQQGCSRAACKRERKRRRDRERYRQRYTQDAAFRTAEKRRRCDCRRRSRARLHTGAGPPSAPTADALAVGLGSAVAELQRTVVGMASLLTGQGDKGTVGEFLAACTDRGRRLEPLRETSP